MKLQSQSDIVILVPRRRDYGNRDRIWEFTKVWWKEHFPAYPIIEGFHEEPGPFNRSTALNRASDAAGNWKIAIILDSDVIIDSSNSIYEAIQVACQDRPVAAFNVRKHLKKEATENILAGLTTNWNLSVLFDEEESISGVVVVNRTLWDQVNGFDECFVGFGYEDLAFIVACEVMSERKLYRVEGILWHLYHDKSKEDNPNELGWQKNRERWLKYVALQYSKDKIKDLTREYNLNLVKKSPIIKEVE